MGAESRINFEAETGAILGGERSDKNGAVSKKTSEKMICVTGNFLLKLKANFGIISGQLRDGGFGKQSSATGVINTGASGKTASEN